MEDGEEQQAGPAAGVVVIDLKHVDTTLGRGKSHLIPFANSERRRADPTHSSGRPSTYWSNHHQSDQEAGHADEEQQQLPAVAPSDQVGVKVSHGRHQRLQTHKLEDTCGIVCR